MNYKEETIELISKEISICEKNNCTHSQVEFSLDQLYMIIKALEAKEPEVVTDISKFSEEIALKVCVKYHINPNDKDEWYQENKYLYNPEHSMEIIKEFYPNGIRIIE